MSKQIIQPTYIDGIASSQAIDTAGEIVDLKGLDISSLVAGPINWEHQKDLPAQIVGKILEAKKIFSKEDCSNDRQAYYWSKCEIPFLYIVARLFDDKKPSSVEVAALFKDDAEHPEEPDMVGFSVEGAKIEKVGAIVTRSIARKVTVTVIPANKTCIAEMIPDKSKRKDGDISSLFKGEMELFKFEPTYQEILEKKEFDLKKEGSAIPPIMVDAGRKAFGSVDSPPPSVPSTPTPTSGQSSVPSHPIHPTMVDAGRSAFGKKENLNKDVGSGGGAFVGSQLAASEKTKDLKKTLTAGSGMAAPGQLEGGSALAGESLERRTQKVHSMKKGEKNKWSERADQAYKSWGDREKFKGYMKKRMPHLADGEVDAIGRVLALKKDMDKESKMSKMYSSYFGKKESLNKAVSTIGGRELETGHERGIHTQSPSQPLGVSTMGQQVRRAQVLSSKGKAGYGGHYKANFTAKMHSENTLKEQHAMRNPTLKSEDVKKTSDVMMASEDKTKK